MLLDDAALARTVRYGTRDYLEIQNTNRLPSKLFFQKLADNGTDRLTKQ